MVGETLQNCFRNSYDKASRCIPVEPEHHEASWEKNKNHLQSTVPREQSKGEFFSQVTELRSCMVKVGLEVRDRKFEAGDST